MWNHFSWWKSLNSHIFVIAIQEKKNSTVACQTMIDHKYKWISFFNIQSSCQHEELSTLLSSILIYAMYDRYAEAET